MSTSASDAASVSPGVIMPARRRYCVFISYSHADTKWASWLMRRLEGYAVPKRFHGRAAPIGELGRRIAPVFRDRDELPTTSDLGETIRNALRESATLVVICSPASARSRWVQEEIRAFKQLHGERSVFAFIVDGEPKAEGAADDCFSKALRWEVDADGGFSGMPAEVVAADARSQADGPKLAFIRLVAGLLGVGFDELRQRELQRRNRRLTVIAASSAAGMALTFGLAVIAWRARNDAQRRQDQAEGVLTFMLDDFRPELTKLGQLTLLSKVGQKATEYFDSLDPRDLTDTALARQAKALTQIGEVRMGQAEYPDAVRAFSTAYQRAAALAARHPKNGDLLYERGQAEYWIGYLHRRRGDSNAAREWCTRYRDTALALLALDPTRPAWQREVAYGHYNLAVLQVDQRDYEASRAGFLRGVDALQKSLAAAPDDLMLRFTLADAHSWLGTIAHRRGEYSEALARFDQNATEINRLAAAEPKNARWVFEKANSLGLRSTVLSVSGQRELAERAVESSEALLRPLLAADPSNRGWAHVASVSRIRSVTLLRARGDSAGASRALADVIRTVEALVQAAPTDRRFRGSLMASRWINAELQHVAGDPAAAETVADALRIGEGLLRDGKADDAVLYEFSRACAAAAHIAAAAGRRDDAQRHLTRAAEVLRPLVGETRDWRLLDPAARLEALAGRPAESRALIARLEAVGYRPLDPWPATALLSGP